MRGNALSDATRSYAEAALRSLFNSVSSTCKPAAARFSSRCLALEVPGIGSITGERQRSQAKATCDGVALALAAAKTMGLSERERRPAARGNHGMNPMLCFSQ